MENPISRTPFAHIQTGFPPTKNFGSEKSSFPFVEFDSFEVPLSKLDHSPQTFKATIAKSGLINRRPPSRSSRASSRKSSSGDSFSQFNDFAGFDIIEPKVVNIAVELEEDTANESNFILNQSCSHFNESSTNYNKNQFFSSIPFLIGKNSPVDVPNILKSVASLKKCGTTNFKPHSPPKSFSSYSPSKEENYNNTIGSSSSETEVIISDRESIADSGIVNRRTVIKINEKSKSATSINDSFESSEFNREQRKRRSLRSKDNFDTRSLSTSLSDVDLFGGINVSIRNQTDNSKDLTSRMYVRQSDSENRSTRASAFNVRRTIEKRQLQQERSQRKALRDQIREKLKNFTETRQRKESISSNVSSDYSTASNRSKSLSSLHEDQEVSKSECSIFKVQSSPTLDSEKNELRTYLFGSNLDDPVSIKSAKLVASIIPSIAHSFPHLNNRKSSESGETETYKTSEVKLHVTNTRQSSVSNFPKLGNNLIGDISPAIPPRRRSRVSRSAGQLTVEREERPAWLRLAKERRSLRSPKINDWDQFSDKASSIVAPEPDWVTRARKKLESMNICLTSTTDIVSVNSQVTESSSAWSRGGLDALEDLREEVSRISEQLADEATERVVKELGIENRDRKMIEFHRNSKSRESSTERQRVSFDDSTKQTEKSCRLSTIHKTARDEIKFGDLKHDWGGVQSHLSRTVNGKLKETRFGEIQINGATEIKHTDEKTEISKRRESHPKAPDCNSVEPKQVIHFGDNPSDIFTKKSAPLVKSQSSSKFESIAGPDPFNMTAEQLNQNVEEYDFPIPTGNEDTEELLTFLRDSLNKDEAVPVVVSTESPKLKPRSILKKSTENIQLEITEDAAEERNFRKNSFGEIMSSLQDKNGKENSSEGGLKKSLSFSLKPNDEYESDIIVKSDADIDSDPESESQVSLEDEVSAPIRPSRQSDRSVPFQPFPGTNEDNMADTRISQPVSPCNIDHFRRKTSRDSKLYSSLRDSTESNKSKRLAVHEHQEMYSRGAEKQRRSLPTSLDKHKGKNFLFEWEMVQRKKLEDEDNIRKQSVLKPVSAKIKDIVKLHSVSTLRSIFLKDKKGEYNGTVDGTDDIFFQKIPDNSEAMTAKRHNSSSMKSPSIVQRISQINKGGIHEKLDFEKSSNLERQTYSFNNRNIYMADDMPPLINKMKHSHYEPKVSISNKLSKESTTVEGTDKRKDWVNNVQSSLPMYIKEQSKKKTKFPHDRGFANRRSFHEYLPRKDKSLKPFVKKEATLDGDSENEPILASSFISKSDRSNTEDKENSSLSIYSSLFEDQSSRKTVRSSGLTLGTRESGGNNENKENENVYSTRGNAKEDLIKNDIGKYERIKSIRERINAINHTGNIDKKKAEVSSSRALSPVFLNDSGFVRKSREPSPFSGFRRELSPSNVSTSSILSTIENESRPVSLSSILEKDVSPQGKISAHRGASTSELSELTKRYRKTREKSSKISTDNYETKKYREKNTKNSPEIKYSADLARNNRDQKQIPSTTNLSSRETKKKIKESRIYSTKSQSDKEKNSNSTNREGHIMIKHTSLGEFSKSSSRIKRKSSLKKSRSKENVHRRRHLVDEDTRIRQRKDSDTNSERYESVGRTPGGGWTKTTVRKTRLGSGSSDKSLTKKGKNSRDSFKVEASNILEKWALGTKIQGKLLKKEGQKYSHQVEEIENEGKKSTKAIARRIVRRGSRRLSKGGELVSEIKEVASGDPSLNDRTYPSDALAIRSPKDKNGVSRNMKSSTDGERYVTKSVHTEGGIKTTTTTGIDNKTIKSQEIIGGEGWEGKRQVSNSLGEKLIIERSVGPKCRPSTVTKKAKTQSKFIITKTKMKIPMM